MIVKLKMIKHLIKVENVSNSIDDILKEEYDKSMGDIEKR